MPLCPFDSGYLCTFLWSMTPLLEMRASLPLGYLSFGLTLFEALIISSLGGILTAAVVLWLLPYVETFGTKHIPFLKIILEKLYAKTRRKTSGKFKKFGHAALVLFVAIPLPGSGAWSGVLAAHIFGIPYKKAILLVGLGVLLSGLLIAIITVSGAEIWQWITSKANEAVEALPQ